MKKYTKMVLAGVLLSSAVLGANTSVVKAASSNPLNVDTSAITDVIQNNVIHVINELLNSDSTANKVNSQKNFSDLKDGDALYVAPIFGEKDATTYEKTLQGELNVVDDNGQLVPMDSVGTDKLTGFVKSVRYTLNGTTKNINVIYNFGMPTISFKNNQVMNFKDSDGLDAINSAATAESSVDLNTPNGDDAHGDVNSPSVKVEQISDLTKPQVKLKLTPSDNYVPEGIDATRTVNIYSEPDLSSLNNDTDSNGKPIRAVTNEKDLSEPNIVVNKNGQRFSVVATPTDDTSPANGVMNVNYTETAIDSKGNVINDGITGNPLTFIITGKVAINSGKTYPLISYEDTNSHKIVYTSNSFKTAGTSGTISAQDIQDALDSSGYTLISPSDFSYKADKYTGTYMVYRETKNNITFRSISDGKPVGSVKELKGQNGTRMRISSPTGYNLVDDADILQTLDADQPNRDVYVKPELDSENALSYTVTFKDKSTNKVVGTEVKGTGSFGTYVSLTAPSNYAFASILDNGFILLRNNQNVTKYVVAADTPYSISYVDQDTGKEVGTEAGKGADGSKIVLKAPADYAFVSADDVNYTIDKDTPTSTVYVQKSDQTEDNIVSGYPKNGYIKIYDEKGKLNNDVVLSEGSSWIIDKSLTINGAEYYRVATNEYVKASDVYKYTPLQTVATTNGKNLTPVYNSRGQVIIDRALDTNTPWYTDRSATIKGQKMYRVATDEWIKASDSTLR